MKQITYDLIECRVLYARYLERQIHELAQIYPQEESRSDAITALIMEGLCKGYIEVKTDEATRLLIRAPVEQAVEVPVEQVVEKPVEATALIQRAQAVMGDHYTAPKAAPVTQKTDYSSMLFEEVQ
tara:strand:+ start:801 stop:1178 length:378 start_codon:yes stop_codon:yes gene_type:complete